MDEQQDQTTEVSNIKVAAYLSEMYSELTDIPEPLYTEDVHRIEHKITEMEDRKLYPELVESDVEDLSHMVNRLDEDVEEYQGLYSVGEELEFYVQKYMENHDPETL